MAWRTSCKYKAYKQKIAKKCQQVKAGTNPRFFVRTSTTINQKTYTAINCS